MNKIIYIDVDDTIAKTRVAIVKYYRLFTNDFSTHPKMVGANMHYDVLCPKWDRKRLTYAFMDSIFFSLLEPVQGAVEGINYLIGKGYDVKICTAHREDGEMMKRAWIRSHFPMVKEVIVTRPFVPKDDYVGFAFLDDSIDNLINNKSEIKILFDIYGILCYNKDIVKITNWEQIKEVL